MRKNHPQLDRNTVFQISAMTGLDPRTVAKHVARPHVPVSLRGGGARAKAAVLEAAAKLGVRQSA
jgi:hypothetical protein